MNAKRNLAIASLLLAGAAGAVWGSSRMSWMGVTIADGLTVERSVDVAGHTWAPALAALWLVFLAAIAAGLALKNWARGVVAVIVAVAAIGTALPGRHGAHAGAGHRLPGEDPARCAGRR